MYLGGGEGLVEVQREGRTGTLGGRDAFLSVFGACQAITGVALFTSPLILAARFTTAVVGRPGQQRWHPGSRRFEQGLQPWQSLRPRLAKIRFGESHRCPPVEGAVIGAGWRQKASRSSAD
jgi:hypothetical protein